MDLNILDENFSVIDSVGDYQSLIWTERYCKIGDFQIITVIREKMLEDLVVGRMVTSSDSEYGMIVREVTIETSSEEGYTITAKGESFESILKQRIIWKQTRIDGLLQDGVQRLINDAIINPEIAERKIPNFVFVPSTDSYITGLRVDKQFTGDNLYDAIVILCAEFGLGFKVILNQKNVFEFHLYHGVDRSYLQNQNPYVEFSPKFENLITSKYKNSRTEYCNVALVAGEGEGDLRTRAVAGDAAASGTNRFELYVDARDLTSTKEDGNSKYTKAEYENLLNQRGLDKLQNYSEENAFDGKAETNSGGFVYGENYFIGDIVNTEDGFGHSIRSRVTEYIRSIDETGVSNYPTFEEVIDL